MFEEPSLRPRFKVIDLGHFSRYQRCTNESVLVSFVPSLACLDLDFLIKLNRVLGAFDLRNYTFDLCKHIWFVRAHLICASLHNEFDTLI
jgi:hypothetical protein